MGKRKSSPPPAAPAGPFNPAFAGLAGRVAGASTSTPTATPTSTSSGAPPALPRLPGAPSRAVVRMERSGRGGKTVTVVEKLALPPTALAAWLKDLKQALGCGGAVERDALVLQGDLRERARAALEARGVTRITVA